MKKNKAHITFQGLCTHFGGAESLGNQFKIDRQKAKYKDFLKICKEKKIEPKIRHIACSAAALAMPDTVYDLVRVGVAQYGFWPSPDIYYHHLSETDKKSDGALKRIFSWKTILWIFGMFLKVILSVMELHFKPAINEDSCNALRIF